MDGLSRADPSAGDVDNWKPKVDELAEGIHISWEALQSPVVDQGPLFLSCTGIDIKNKQIVGVTSLEKNRFCELVRFDLGCGRWSSCTRTRHFRPPKRVGAAAVTARGHLFVFGGYELSNQLDRGNSGGRGGPLPPPGLPPPLKRVAQDTPSPQHLLSLFAHPLWWLGGEAYLEWTRSGSAALGDALGDFHAYDMIRADWTVLINRDRVPVVSSSSAQQQGGWLHTTTSSSASSSWGSSDWRRRGSASNYTQAPQDLSSGNSPTDPLPAGRAFHTLVKHGSMVYLFGGEHFAAGGSSVEYFNDVWACDLQGLRWTQIWVPSTAAVTNRRRSSGSGPPKLSYRDQLLRQIEGKEQPSSNDQLQQRLVVAPAPRSGHAAVVSQRVLYVIGGQNSTRVFDDLWAFDLRRGNWTNLMATGEGPGPVCGHTALLVGKCVVVFGGISPSDFPTMLQERLSGNLRRPLEFSFANGNRIYVLDLTTLHWTAFTALGSPAVDARYFGPLHAFVLDGMLWAGGSTGAEDFRGFEMTRATLPQLCLTNAGRSVLTETTSAAASVGSSSCSSFLSAEAFLRQSAQAPVAAARHHASWSEGLTFPAWEPQTFARGTTSTTTIDNDMPQQQQQQQSLQPPLSPRALQLLLHAATATSSTAPTWPCPPAAQPSMVSRLWAESPWQPQERLGSQCVSSSSFDSSADTTLPASGAVSDETTHDAAITSASSAVFPTLETLDENAFLKQAVLALMDHAGLPPLPQQQQQQQQQQSAEAILCALLGGSVVEALNGHDLKSQKFL